MLMMRNKNMVNVGAFDIIVSPNGNDSTGTGKLNAPYKTIQKGVDVATAGKTVFALPGLYAEALTIGVSGSAGNPITIKGSRGPNSGDHLTVIDNSTDVSGSWVADPGVGEGVYKKQLGFAPGQVTVNGKRIGKLHDNIMGVDGEGWDILGYASDHEVVVLNTGLYVVFWDGIQVVCAYDQTAGGSGYTYIRFQYGTNPNTMTIRATAADTDGIYATSKSYITIQDLWIQNNEHQIEIREASYNNIIEDCYLVGGSYRIYTFGDVNGLIVRRNEMTMNYYAGDQYLGAGSTSSYALLVKRHIYDTFKYKFGPNLSNDIGYYFRNIGEDIEIYENYVHGGLIGISGYNGDYGYDDPANGVKIHDNIVHNMGSIGITTGRNITNGEVYNNLLYDCNINFRLHELHHSGDYARSWWIYSNVAWNPTGTGVHFYMHFPVSSTPSFFPTYFIYSNIMVCGYDGFNADSNINLGGGIPNFSIFNNIILTNGAILSAMRTAISDGDVNLVYNNAVSNSYSLGSKYVDNVYFSNSTYGFLNYTSIDDFLANFDKTDFAITQYDRTIFDPDPPYTEQTWI